MPYVPVPKDLTKVKTKLAFNLTKRQLICFSLAGLVGLPVYFFTRGAIGNSAAVLLMIGLMMPFFFFAMYERDGQPAEKILGCYYSTNDTDKCCYCHLFWRINQKSTVSKSSIAFRTFAGRICWN